MKSLTWWLNLAEVVYYSFFGVLFVLAGMQWPPIPETLLAGACGTLVLWWNLKWAYYYFGWKHDNHEPN